MNVNDYYWIVVIAGLIIIGGIPDMWIYGIVTAGYGFYMYEKREAAKKSDVLSQD